MIVRKSTIEKELKTAIDNEQIYITYQPQFCVTTKKLIGFEALARWKHPELGEISPDEFIEAAEQNEQIINLGQYIQRKSLSTYAKWVEHNADLELAINASLLEITNNEYTNFLTDIIKQLSINPKKITIEVTENLVIDQTQLLIDAIDNLHKQGVCVAIDDFGTGYSTLERLKYLKADLLKIDKAFVDDIETKSKAKKLLRSIIHLAKSVKMPTLAEGIENEQQLKILKELGCDFAQGFYFSKPLQENQAEKMLQQDAP